MILRKKITIVMLSILIFGSFVGMVSFSNNYTIKNEPAEVPIEAPQGSYIPDPILHYEFNNFSDSRGNGPNGIPVGNAFIVSNGINGSGLFIQSASNELIIPIPDTLLALDELTVQFWFKQYDPQPLIQNLVQKGNISTQSTFFIYRYPWDTYNTATVIAGHGTVSNQWAQVSNPNNLTFGVWHLVTYVKAQEWHAYWLDGQMIHYDPIYEEVKNTSDPIRIGVNAINLYFDELKIWNSYLPESMIQDYYKTYFPLADFSTDKTTAAIGEPVWFYDETSGGYPPYSYYWDFDDSSYSYEQNPIHYFYNTSKTEFCVTLRVTDWLGNESIVKKTIYIYNPIGYFELFSESGDYSRDGRIKLNWTRAENATSYDIYENDYFILTVPENIRSFEQHKTNPGVYSYIIKAQGPSGLRDSNLVSITTDIFPGAFSLWSYEAGNPDLDGVFSLQWGESLNAESFEIYQDNVLIQVFGPSSRDLKINVNESRTYVYFVRAKNSRGVFNSNLISISVSLNSNQTGNQPGGQSDGTDILKFLQENGSFIAGGAAGAMAIGVLLKIIRGGKGKIKVKLPKGSIAAPTGSNDDFFDSEF